MAYTPVPIPIFLDEAARILSIEPAHFNQSVGGEVAHQFCGPDCGDLWGEESWQSPGGLSRAGLARNLAQAAIEIERFLGRPLVPMLRHRYVPLIAPIDPQLFTGVRLFLGEHLADYHPYAPSLIGQATVDDDGVAGTIEFEDVDGDGFSETVRVSMESAMPVSEDALVFYIGGNFGKVSAQIGPARNVEIAGQGPWTITATFDPWQLIDPDRFFAVPDPNRPFQMIDLTNMDVYIDSMDFGVMLPQLGEPRVRFLFDDRASPQWIEGTWTSAGETAWAYPATWNSETQAWEPSAGYDTSNCDSLSGIGYRWPAAAEVSYYTSYSPPTPRSELAQQLKEPLALLAAARLKVSRCECDCTNGAWYQSLRDDLAATAGTRYTSTERLNSVFGSLRGEQYAYDRLRALEDKKLRTRHGSY